MEYRVDPLQMARSKRVRIRKKIPRQEGRELQLVQLQEQQIGIRQHYVTQANLQASG